MKIWLGMKLRLTSNVVFNSIQTGGGGGFRMPERTLDVYNGFKKQAKATKLGEFS